MNRKNYTFLCGAIFLVVALFHLFALLLGWKIAINGKLLSSQISIFIVVLACAMSFLGLGLSKSK